MGVGVASRERKLPAGLALAPLNTRHARDLARIAADRRVGPPAGLPHPLPPDWPGYFCEWRVRAASAGEALTFAVVSLDRVIGCASLYDIDRITAEAELSIWLAREAWGRGIGTRVCNGLLREAFESEQLRVVWARHHSDNVRAARLLRRAGFREHHGARLRATPLAGPCTPRMEHEDGTGI